VVEVEMEYENIPNERFAWLGIAPPPDGVVVPEDNPVPIVKDILPPNQVTGADEGLGIFRWLMADEDERQDTLSGCRLLDNFVYMQIPKEDD
jgi:hypothetical protein